MLLVTIISMVLLLSYQGLTDIEVRNMNDILMVMHEGEHNRTVADTKMNKNRYYLTKLMGHYILCTPQFSISSGSDVAC